MKEKLKSKSIEPKLWTKNFFLLWQGQMVSCLGDVLYLIALDFWVLDVTGSTALMGALSALTMLPRIILGPFAGVFVDKWKRKNVIIFTDLIRGIVITSVGILALMGYIQVWMVFVIGILSGVCQAFFGPAVSALRPEIVDESRIIKANSVTSIADSGMNILGSVVGGVLYIAIGAPYMFLANGISFLFSAFTEIFIREPQRVRKEKEELTYKEDLKGGFKFIWRFKTLRNLMLTASILNLLASSAFILILPYFKSMEFLGPERYGVFSAVMSVGMLAGSFLLSVVNIKKDYKYGIFAFSTIFCMATLPILFLLKNFILMLIIAFFTLSANVIFNTLFQSTLAVVVPSDMRGKVFALLGTISGGMQPIGAFVGGVLGQVLPIQVAIVSILAVDLLLGIIMVLPKGVKKLIEYDSSDGTVDELINITNGDKIKVNVSQ